jgi:hypothetical protein
LLDDLRAQVALAEQRVAEDDPSPDRQDAQQFQSGLVLVGLGIDLDLGQDSVMLVGISGDEVLTGRRAVAAAAQRLAVEGNRLGIGFLGRGHAGGDPAREGGLEGTRVEAAEEFAKAGGGRCLTAKKSQSMGQFDPVVAAELGDGGGPFAAAEHGQDGQGEDGQQWVATSLAATRVGHVRESLKQGTRSHRANLRSGRARMPPLPNPSRPANLNQQIALEL